MTACPSQCTGRHTRIFKLESLRYEFWLYTCTRQVRESCEALVNKCYSKYNTARCVRPPRGASRFETWKSKRRDRAHDGVISRCTRIRVNFTWRASILPRADDWTFRMSSLELIDRREEEEQEDNGKRGGERGIMTFAKRGRDGRKNTNRRLIGKLDYNPTNRVLRSRCTYARVHVSSKKNRWAVATAVVAEAACGGGNGSGEGRDPRIWKECGSGERPG